MVHGGVLKNLGQLMVALAIFSMSSMMVANDSMQTLLNLQQPKEAPSENPANICLSNPYVGTLSTPLNEIATRADTWLNNMDQHLARTSEPAMTQWNHDRFYPFEEMTSCNTTCIGGACREDTSKIMCGAQELKEGCVVYSIGGNNFWQFENGILKNTPCEVHTFDCTGDISRFHKPDNERLTFHHICLGTESAPAPSECVTAGNQICGKFMTIHEIQRMLGHSRIDLLKMDIEGYEWPIYNSWPELSNREASRDVVLPMQLLVEVRMLRLMNVSVAYVKHSLPFLTMFLRRF
jgi:hypothetical protein